MWGRWPNNARKSRGVMRFPVSWGKNRTAWNKSKRDKCFILYRERRRQRQFEGGPYRWLKNGRTSSLNGEKANRERETRRKGGTTQSRLRVEEVGTSSIRDESSPRKEGVGDQRPTYVKGPTEKQKKEYLLPSTSTPTGTLALRSHTV